VQCLIVLKEGEGKERRKEICTKFNVKKISKLEARKKEITN